MPKPKESIRDVVILAMDPTHVDREKFGLRRYPVKVSRVFPTGQKALKYLEAYTCDIVICDDSVADMPPLDFLRQVKKIEAFRHIPVMLITMAVDRETLLEAVSLGACGYILRPYEDETFRKHMENALQMVREYEQEMAGFSEAKSLLESGNYDDAIEEFENIVSMQNEAEKLYEEGCQFMMQEKLGQAILAFQKAIRINNLFAEAYQGLAKAFKAKGDMKQFEFFLKKAAMVHAEFNRLERVKEIFIEIVKLDREAANPFNELGIKLRAENDYQGAVSAYRQAIQISPEDENIRFNLAKAYHLLQENGKAVEALKAALEINPEFAEARKFYTALTRR